MSKSHPGDYHYILGVQSFANQDSGACLVRFSKSGSELDYIAISEERLIRKKYPYSFPLHSIAYCMEGFGLQAIDQIDLLVADHIRVERWFNSGPGYNKGEFDYLKLKLDFDPKKIISIEHHMAHAASAFYASPFADASILIIDGNGSDLETTSFFAAKNNKITRLETYKAHGIGAAYSAVSRDILNLGMGGEGKTMGLAPYGEKHPQVLDIATELDGIKNDLSSFMRRMPYSDVLNQLDDSNRINPLKKAYRVRGKSEDALDPYFSRVAYDLQQETERVVTHLGKVLDARSESKNLCMAGGVALNSVANKIMFDNTSFENIFVFPACSDSGIPFGLAMWGYYNAEQFQNVKKRKLNFSNAYTGVEYSQQSIEALLQANDIPFELCDCAKVAELIAEGNIVAWHQGASEYGPRALGHRSIFTDSRRAEMRDILNFRVKHRENYRPFAPIVLLEDCEEYFEIKGDSPYMLLVADVRKPEVIPSVTHVDGTARVQTVTREGNGVVYDLVAAFKAITGVPVILNTSFNDAGEPIVETPADSLICFLGTDIDFLVLGSVMINAQGLNKTALYQKLTAERAEQIAARALQLREKFCPGYDTEERDLFIREENKVAEWHVKYRARYELEKKVQDWVLKRKKILVIGTDDHSQTLLRHVNNFYRVEVAAYLRIEPRFELREPNEEFSGFAYARKVDWTNAFDGIDEILISSHEYQNHIVARLEALGVQISTYLIYDNVSRNMIEVLSKLPKYRPAPKQVDAGEPPI